jgi:hypothetical protein
MPVERRWASVTEWFEDAARDVLAHRDAPADGGAPTEAEHFDP